MPILILILLALCPGLLIAVGHGLLVFFGMGAVIETKRALFSHPPAQPAVPQPARVAILLFIGLVSAIAVYAWSSQFVGGVANGWLTP